MNEQQETIEQLKAMLREVLPVLRHANKSRILSQAGDCVFCNAHWGLINDNDEWHEDGCVMLRIDEVLNGNE